MSSPQRTRSVLSLLAFIGLLTIFSGCSFHLDQRQCFKYQAFGRMGPLLRSSVEGNDVSDTLSETDWRAFRKNLIAAYGEDDRKLWSDNEWAHEITHVENGCLLIATDRADGHFRRSVILVLNHDPLKGSTGLVLNKPTSQKVEQVAGLHRALKGAFRGRPVHDGGRAHRDRLYGLHWDPAGVAAAAAADAAADEAEGGGPAAPREVLPGVRWGPLEGWIAPARAGRLGGGEGAAAAAPRVAVARGRNEWYAGQLELEIEAGFWLTACASPQVVMEAAAQVGRRGAPGGEDYFHELLALMGGRHAELARYLRRHRP